MKHCVPTFCLVSVLLVSSAVPAPLPPEKAANTFTVADGLEMKLWASEPLCVNPTCLDIDHKGRVWVCESVNSRSKLVGKKKPNRPEGGRIVILEDGKGSGKADKATTFYQSPILFAPRGIALAAEPSRERKGTVSYKVYVCHSPDILLFEDKDGDGKADRPPKKLLSGFGGFDPERGVHGIFIGHDGKLYFSVGDQGVHGLQSSDGKGRKWTSNDSDCRAGTVWRCDLDGKNLELIAHNFHNPQALCVDSFGTLFAADNGDAGQRQSRLCYVMQGGDYGYLPLDAGRKPWNEDQPGIVPKIAGLGSATSTGMCVYEGTLLPKKYQNALLLTDAGGHRVTGFTLKTEGAGYSANRANLAASSDVWFRPSGICTAADGSVFIADQYDLDSSESVTDETKYGRVYRLAPKESKYGGTNVDLNSKDGIRAALASSALSQRALVLARLKDLPADEVKKTLDPSLAQNDDPYLRARALWQVYSRKGLPLQPSQIAVARAIMEPPDPRLSAMTLRLTKDAHGISMAYYGDVLNKYIYGLPTAARREALLQLRGAETAKAKPHIRELAMKYDGKDRFYLEALNIALGPDKTRRGVLLADFDKRFVEWDDHIDDLVWALRPPGMLPILESRLGDAKLTAAQRARTADTIAAYDDKDAGSILLKAVQAGLPAEARRKVFDNLLVFLPGKWQRLRGSPELNAAIKDALSQAETRATALTLIGLAQKTDEVNAVIAWARNKNETESVRRAAVRTLGQLPTPAAVEALQVLLKDSVEAMRFGVVPALAELSEQKTNAAVADTARKQLQDLVRDAKNNRAPAAAAVEALARTYAGAKWLLDLHDKKELPESLQGEAGRLLRAGSFPTLRKRALAAFPPPNKLDP